MKAQTFKRNLLSPTNSAFRKRKTFDKSGKNKQNAIQNSKI
jgi:hypothetical protein